MGERDAMPVILALGQQGQENCSKFEAILVSITSCDPLRSHNRILCHCKRKQTQRDYFLKTISSFLKKYDYIIIFLSS